MAIPRGLTPLEAANEIRNANNGQVVLVLQGGGALGAYQGGVYQALHDAGIEPDWLIGTSIGAINASHHRRQPGRGPPPEASGILAARRALDIVGRLPCLHRRRRRALLMDDARDAASPASSRPICAPSSAPMCRSAPTMPAILDRAVAPDAGRARRLLAHQRGSPAAYRRRRACAHQHDALFRLEGDGAWRRRTSWRQARCRRPSPPCASTASFIGTAASSPTRRPSASSTIIRGGTR